MNANVYRIPSRADEPPVDYPRYARPIPVEHLGIVEGVDLYECLRANADAPRLAVLRDRSLRLRAARAIALASVALALFTVLYFGGQLFRTVLS
jgi:hypothetical protein